MQEFRSPKSAQQGVVLIEAMLAIVIFSIGVLAVVGLQAAMIKNADESKFRAEASYIAQKRIGEIWAAGTSNTVVLDTFLETDTNISALLPGGKRTVALTTPGDYQQFQVTVKWTRPGAGATEHNYTTTASIAGN
jgi:type IV pilus assembly protein PilV